MKPESFLNTLRKIIREEVRNAVRQELNEALNTKKPYKEVINHGVNLQREAAKPAVKKQYVKNEMLNNILNETSTINDGGWDTLEFKSELAQAYGMNSTNIIQDMSGNAFDVNDLKKTDAGAAVARALTRDYSSLMKAINKK